MGLWRAGEFEQAYRTASAVLDDDEYCLAYEVARGVEEPEHYTVRIEWDSVEGHEQGFRKSARFGEFFAAIQEMKHYDMRFGSSR